MALLTPRRVVLQKADVSGADLFSGVENYPAPVLISTYAMHHSTCSHGGVYKCRAFRHRRRLDDEA
jgi:hypothetical protein